MASQRPEWAVPLTVAGTTLSAFLSGAIASISLVSIPVVVSKSSTLTPANTLGLWRGLFDNGIRIAPPLAIAAALVHTTNAYIHYSSLSAQQPSSSGAVAATRQPSFLIAGAAVFTVAIVPFTFLFMSATNTELMARESGAVGEAGKGGAGVAGMSTAALVSQWGKLNLMRSVLPAVGALLGFGALVTA